MFLAYGVTASSALAHGDDRYPLGHIFRERHHHHLLCMFAMILCPWKQNVRYDRNGRDNARHDSDTCKLHCKRSVLALKYSKGSNKLPYAILRLDLAGRDNKLIVKVVTKALVHTIPIYEKLRAVSCDALLGFGQTRSHGVSDEEPHLTRILFDQHCRTRYCARSQGEDERMCYSELDYDTTCDLTDGNVINVSAKRCHYLEILRQSTFIGKEGMSIHSIMKYAVDFSKESDSNFEGSVVLGSKGVFVKGKMYYTVLDYDIKMKSTEESSSKEMTYALSGGNTKSCSSQSSLNVMSMRTGSCGRLPRSS